VLVEYVGMAGCMLKCFIC